MMVSEKNLKYSILLGLLLCIASGAVKGGPVGEEGIPSRYQWNGYELLDSALNGINYKIVFPKIANQNRDWIWRARFWGHEPQTDIALLELGFHVAYVEVGGLFGNEKAIKVWDGFYQKVVGDYRLNPKVVLEGMSRGGLIVYNWANRNAEKVACIYADAPVCDIKSWPGGKGNGTGSVKDWKTCLEQYQLTEEEVMKFKGNPVDHMENIAKEEVPVLHVVGDLDRVVPVSENSDNLEKRLESLGWNMKVIHKPDVGHHPHSLKNPEPIVDFILKNTGNLQNYLEESRLDYVKRIQWFTDAQYGMFIHFGLYSQLGGEWEGKEIDHYAEWIQANADIPAQVYAMLTSTFNPKDFNADFIAKTAKDAGMKYIVITSKHHEGFCLWDSEYTNFDVASTPFAGRDILAELSAACKKQGIRFGTYYSIIDWHHPAQERNIDGEDSGNRWGNVRLKSGRKEEYINYMKNQIRELIEKYDTDILWFDGDWVYWWDMASGKELYQYIRELKPEILINNRVAKRVIFKKDFGTPEQEHPGESLEYEWEACYTMNHSWGYKKSDNNWKDAQTVYDKLQDINAKGGNLLLNIGPDGNGNVPKESVEILLRVGKMIRESEK